MPAAKTKASPSPEAAAPKNMSVAVPTLIEDAQEAMTATTYAKAFAVTSASDSAKGQEARARLNSKIKDLTERRLKITRLIDASKKEVMDLFAGPIMQFTLARDAIDQKVIAWDSEQEELRRAEQRRLDKIAEDQRRELQRKADEAKAKADAEAEQLRKEAAEKQAAGDREAAAKLNAKAERVEEKAADKADLLEDRAAAVVAPVAVADTARVGGTSFRETAEFEIIDENGINKPFMTPDQVKIGRVVRSLGLEAVSVVGPGLKVTMKKGLASRRT